MTRAYGGGMSLELSPEQRAVDGSFVAGGIVQPERHEYRSQWLAATPPSGANGYLAAQVRARDNRSVAIVACPYMLWDRSSGFQWAGGVPVPAVDTCGWQLAPLTTLTAEKEEVRGLTMLTDRFDSGVLVFPAEGDIFGPIAAQPSACAWLEGEAESAFRVRPPVA